MLFKHVESPIKKFEGRVQDFERRQSAKWKRAERQRKKSRIKKLQLKEQEAKNFKAEKKRLEEIKMEKQHQEALLRHHQMILENKRKQKDAEKQR